MTVATTTRKVTYPSGGTTFPVSFPFFSASDLQVTVDGAVTADWTITGVPRAGTASVVLAASTSKEVVITRAIPLLQPTTFPVAGRFSPAAHEAALDRLLFQLQDEVGSRADAILAETQARADAILAEAVARNAAVQAVINSGAQPANVGLAVVTPTGGTQGRTVNALMAERLSVLSFAGVDPTGVADSISGLEAAVAKALETGADLIVPRGFYRTTRILHIGQRIFSTYDWLVNRTTEVTSEFSSNLIGAAQTANYQLPAISIIFEAGAYIIPDWSPASVEPVVSYNLSRGGKTPPTGRIVGLSVIAPTSFVGGKYVETGNRLSNKLIGLVYCSAAKEVRNFFANQIEHGVASYGAFWTDVANVVHNFGAGDGLVMLGANACHVRNVTNYSTGRLLVWEGQGSVVEGIHSEQALEDVTILAAECCKFGPMYLEDYDASDARSRTGKYAVTLGQGVGAWNKILYCEFVGIRVGSVGYGGNVKQAYRFRGTNYSMFKACRSYGHGINYDNTSCNFSVEACDFESNLASYLSDTLTGGVVNLSGPLPRDRKTLQINQSGSATVPIDCASSDYFLINFTFAGNIVIGGPTNAKPGQIITLHIQNSSGSPRTISWTGGAGNWGGGFPTASLGNGITRMVTAQKSSNGYWYPIAVVTDF